MGLLDMASFQLLWACLYYLCSYWEGTTMKFLVHFENAYLTVMSHTSFLDNSIFSPRDDDSRVSSAYHHN